MGEKGKKLKAKKPAKAPVQQKNLDAVMSKKKEPAATGRK